LHNEYINTGIISALFGTILIHRRALMLFLIHQYIFSRNNFNCKLCVCYAENNSFYPLLGNDIFVKSEKNVHCKLKLASQDLILQKDELYKQKNGVRMDSPLVLTLANFFMAILEQGCDSYFKEL